MSAITGAQLLRASCLYFNGQVQRGVVVFGFAVGVYSSFLQVAVYRGRFLLHDGYHRAYGFLTRGISRVPAIVKEFPTFDAMRLPPGLLPQDAYLGVRPPFLTDYLDETVPAAVELPATQKVVVIQALELATLGSSIINSTSLRRTSRARTCRTLGSGSEAAIALVAAFPAPDQRLPFGAGRTILPLPALPR